MMAIYIGLQVEGTSNQTEAALGEDSNRFAKKEFDSRPLMADSVEKSSCFTMPLAELLCQWARGRTA
ncbi:hypothetical protein D3C80_1779420 [compost metagenome]